MKAAKTFTVKVGRHGFNGEYLASVSVKDAQAAFKNIDPKTVSQAHAEAVNTKKEMNKAKK